MLELEPWRLAMIDEAGYNGITDEHTERVSASVRSVGLSEIDGDILERHCFKCGINPHNFTKTDIEKLKRRLKG